MHIFSIKLYCFGIDFVGIDQKLFVVLVTIVLGVNAGPAIVLNEFRGLQRPFDEYGLPTLSLQSLPQNVLTLQNPAEFLRKFQFLKFEFYCIKFVIQLFFFLNENNKQQQHQVFPQQCQMIWKYPLIVSVVSKNPILTFVILSFI